MYVLGAIMSGTRVCIGCIMSVTRVCIGWYHERGSCMYWVVS